MISMGEKLLKKKQDKERIILFDILRGLFILLVMIDHFFYDAYFMYRKSFQTLAFQNLVAFGKVYYYSLYRTIIRPIGLFVFFCISGILTDFSRSNLFRAIKYGIVALLIFVATFVFAIITNSYNCIITIGVMYVFTVCALVGWLLKKITVPNFVLLIIGLVLSGIGLIYYFGATDFLTDKLFFLLFNLEVGHNYSADYFSLLPFLGYFILGIYISRVFYKQKKAYITFNKPLKVVFSPFVFLGKTSLWWYLISQGAFVVFFEICLFFGA